MAFWKSVCRMLGEKLETIIKNSFAKAEIDPLLLISFKQNLANNILDNLVDYQADGKVVKP